MTESSYFKQNSMFGFDFGFKHYGGMIIDDGDELAMI